MSFKLNPIVLSLLAVPGLILPVQPIPAAIIKPFDPQKNDDKAGVFCVCNGSTQSLTGLPQFAAGKSGAVTTTLGQLQKEGRIFTDNLTGRERLSTGAQNFDVLIADAQNGIYTHFQAYDSLAIAQLAPVSLSQSVTDYEDVHGAQYLDARVAQVSHGTINVALGQPGADTLANGWAMAAKQSRLFTATQSGNINWAGDNRVTFTAIQAPAGARWAYDGDSLVTYSGNIAVTTKDGNTTRFTITQLSDLRQYNDWLIAQLAVANLDPARYNAEFNKAFTLSTGSVVWALNTRDLHDEVLKPTGERVVLSADVPGATATIQAGKSLEVANASGGAMRADHGATAIVNGRLAASGDALNGNEALVLSGNSRGINNGVINGGFFRRADGSGAEGWPAGNSENTVLVQGSHFTNNGVINHAISAAPPRGSSSALTLTGSADAVNNGALNLGMTDVNGSGSSSAVTLAEDHARFINNGTLYLGRSAQDRPGDSSQDMALRQSGGTFGINQFAASSAINNGQIVLGSKVQNAVAMQVSGSADAVTRNNGIIVVNGRAQFRPAENVALQVKDAGSAGQVGNAGIITLNGDNATGLKVIATADNRAYGWSSGVINVTGEADALNGTRNTAVWVSAEPGGTASADVSGPIRLSGRAAIGIRAEGNATVTLAPDAGLVSAGGEDQISYLADGPAARINLPAGGTYRTAGTGSTLFRYQEGADFDGRGMTLAPDGVFSTGVIGSGAGTAVFTHGASLEIGGYATGVVIEGGAQGEIDAASRITLEQAGSTVAMADGNKHDLTRYITNPIAHPWSGTLLVNNATINGSGAGQRALIAQNQAQLINNGSITLSGGGSYAIQALTGGKVENNADIAIAGDSAALYAEGYRFSGDGVTPAAIINYAALHVSAGDAPAYAPAHGMLGVGDRAELYQNGTVTLSGSHSVAVEVDSARATLSAGSRISGDSAGQTALIAGNGAAIFNQGSLTLGGDNSTAARLYSGGNLINSGTIEVARGIGIDVSDGNGQYTQRAGNLHVGGGTAALRVGRNGILSIAGDGEGESYDNYPSTLWSSGGADTVLLDSGAAGLRADHVNLSGGSEGGRVLNNRAETADIALNYVRLDINGGTGIRSATAFDPGGHAWINVTGGGTGYLFANEDGSATHNDLLIGPDYYFFVSGNSTAIRASTTGRVINAGTIAIYDFSGGSAIVTRNASEVINQGNIISLSTAAPIIDLRGGQSRFINTGTISAPFPETVVVAGGASDDQIALLAGSVTGEVNTGNGNDSLQLSGGTLNGSVTMGSGKNQAWIEGVSLAQTRHITSDSGPGSALSFSDITARGGSFSTDDRQKGTNLGSGWSTLNFYHTRWTLTDNLKLAHSTINIDPTSTLFAGNGLNPQLSGATADSLQVNNAGTLDLTNGSGTPGNRLQINGTLASAGGQAKLNTQLRDGGTSDNLLVQGNVSGTTLLAVTPVMSTMPVLTPQQGITLAQVTGSASTQSFALARDYVAAGPYQYGLYASNGETGWHYRLASNFITDSAGRAVRPALTPQMPSWISAPVALAYYNLAVTDDLHKRLGELRSADGAAGEMFIRYLGSALTYHTDRRSQQYGYDFDLDYSAVQLGGNLLHLDGLSDSLRAGIAYTRGNARLRPRAADGYSSTSIDSDTLSLYATWLRDSGWYVDGALSLDWHRGDTDIARQQKAGKLRGNGWSTSLETGYPWPLIRGLRLTPQAQLLYQRLTLDDITDADNARIQWRAYDQTLGRAGLQLDRSWQDAGGRTYTPYVRTSYTRGWGGAASMRAGVSDSAERVSFTSGHIGQMWDAGLGATAALSSDISLYAEADYRRQINGNGSAGWRYNAGMRWAF